MKRLSARRTQCTLLTKTRLGSKANRGATLTTFAHNVFSKPANKHFCHLIVSGRNHFYEGGEGQSVTDQSLHASASMHASFACSFPPLHHPLTILHPYRYNQPITLAIDCISAQPITVSPHNVDMFDPEPGRLRSLAGVARSRS